ncbi:MAG: hypothetical protein U9R34_05995 [Nanoarchaeota archaeon]|nr:hypothetical protein [Nanoarchaeota archaeon]
MVGAILENHKLRLVDYLARAHKRISNAEKTYSKLNHKIKQIQDIEEDKSAKTPAQKRELEVALNDLRKAMIEVIEAEKTMKFMRSTKSSEEIAIEKKILGMEAKLNDYLQYREKRLKKFEELEKKIAAEQPNADLLAPPKPVPESKLPAKIPEAKAETGLLADIKKTVVRLNNTLQILKKDKKYPEAKLAELENKLNKYIKRVKDLGG